MSTRPETPPSFRSRLFRRDRNLARQEAADQGSYDECVLEALYTPTTTGTSSSTTLVDLVFVHGLGGGLRKTWTAKDATDPWIQDPNYLGAVKSVVRVLSFGYNANRFTDVADTRVIDHANSLLRNLVRKRRNCTERPIIFIAHSLGGLIVKEAILLCPGNIEWELLKPSVKSIFFLGTPHFGSAQAKNLEIIQNLVSVLQLKPGSQTNLTRELRNFSNTVMDLNVRFTDHIRKSISIFCFYETKPQMLPSGVSEVIVPKWSAVLPGVDHEQSNSTHSDLPKFSDPSDARFRSFWEEDDSPSVKNRENFYAISPAEDMFESTTELELKSDAIAISPGPPSGNRKQDRGVAAKHRIQVLDLDEGSINLAALFDAIPFSNIGKMAKNDKIVDMAKLESFLTLLKTASPVNLVSNLLGVHPSAFNWVENTTVFRDWLEDEDGGMLFITGHPRCGKTHLARRLQDKLMAGREPYERIVLSFSCSNLESTTSNPPILDHFLRGILEQKNHLFHQVIERFGDPTKTVPMYFGPMMNVLQSLLSDPSAGEIILILDGLDQCPLDFILNFIKAFHWFLQSRKTRSLQDQSTKHSKPRLIILSRPIEAVMGYCPSHFHLHLTPDTIKNDIGLVLRDEISKIFHARQQFDSEEQTVEELILEKASGDFLYATQVSHELWTLENTSNKEVFTLVDKCPPTMELIYQHDLDRLACGNHRDILLLLRLLAFSPRTLTYREVKDALQFRFNSISDDYDLQGKVTNICPGLVRTGPEDTLDLRHYTVKEFLRSKESDSAGHVEMAQLCLDYLMQSDDFGSVVVRPFWPYAAFTWGDHLRSAGPAVDRILDQLSSFFKSPAYIAWDAFTDTDNDSIDDWEPLPLLSTLAIFDLKYLVTAYLFGPSASTLIDQVLNNWPFRGGNIFTAKSRSKISELVNVPNREGGTPILYAINGDGDIFNLLLPYVLDIDHPTKSGKTALHSAAGRAKVDCLSQLLKRGADINCRDEDGNTPLRIACQLQHHSIVRRLLEQGADIELVTKRGDSALLSAIRCNDPECVRLLLQHGADARASTYMVPPLMLALATEDDSTYSALQELLLFVNANETVEDITPLHIAARIGDVQLINILLDHNADPSKVMPADDVTLSPLEIAIGSGNTEAAIRLIEFGAKVDAPTVLSSGPIHEAIRNGLLEVSETLIAAKCDIEARDRMNRTPLVVACVKGNVDMVRLLLGHGASATPPLDGPSPLRACSAAEAETREIVQLLLEADPPAVINHLSPSGSSALGHASRKGYLEVVRMLVNHGADVNLTHRGETPLAHAAEKGATHNGIACLLISQKARLVPQANERISPIHSAAETGNADLVHELLTASEDSRSLANLEFDNGKTPLYRALQCPSFATVQKLLEWEADPGYKITITYNSLSGGTAAFSNKYSMLFAACVGGDIDCFNLIHSTLISRGAELNDAGLGDLLYISCEESHPAIFSRLLELGADVHYSGDFALTLLHCVAKGGSTEILTHMFSAAPNMPVDSQDQDGNTPLMLAARQGHSKIVRLLLNKGAKANLISQSNLSTLHAGIFSRSLATVKAILGTGLVDISMPSICTDDFFKRSVFQNILCHFGQADEAIAALFTIPATFQGDLGDKESALLSQQDIYGLDGVAYANPWLMRTPSRAKLLEVIKSSAHQLRRGVDKQIHANVVGWALLHLGQKPLAVRLFSTRILQDRTKGRFPLYLYHGICCDICGDSDICTSRYVCMYCPDLDLCSSCMIGYVQGKAKLRRCAGHEFLRIPLPKSGDEDFRQTTEDELQLLWEEVESFYQDQVAAGPIDSQDAANSEVAPSILAYKLHHLIRRGIAVDKLSIMSRYKRLAWSWHDLSQRLDAQIYGLASETESPPSHPLD